jgi:Zn-dependent membrane protease YugP
MVKQFTALTATAAILIVGSLVWKAEAAPVTGVCGLAPLTKRYSPVEKAGCWCGPYRCASVGPIGIAAIGVTVTTGDISNPKTVYFAMRLRHQMVDLVSLSMTSE